MDVNELLGYCCITESKLATDAAAVPLKTLHTPLLPYKGSDL